MMLVLLTMRTQMATMKSDSEDPMTVLVLLLRRSWMQEAIADLAGFVATRLIYMAPGQGRHRMRPLLHSTHTDKVLLRRTPAMLHLLDTLVMAGHRQLFTLDGDSWFNAVAFQGVG